MCWNTKNHLLGFFSLPSLGQVCCAGTTLKAPLSQYAGFSHCPSRKAQRFWNMSTTGHSNRWFNATPDPNNPVNLSARGSENKLSQRKKANEPPPTRKPYRPGFNSYLKVVLDESSMSRLRETTLLIRECVINSCHVTFKGQEEGITNNKPSHPIKWKINPRSQESLHLTLFFGGEILSELSPTQLQMWYDKVRDRLQLAGMYASPPEGQDQNIIHNGMPIHNSEEYWIRFDRLSTFPPRRNNLIVALLQASPAWQALYRDLVHLAQDCDFAPELQQIASKSHDIWTPHVTLASLDNLRGLPMQELRRELQSQTPIIQESSDVTVRVCGIAMGGPVPSQTILEWNFLPRTPLDDS